MSSDACRHFVWSARISMWIVPVALVLTSFNACPAKDKDAVESQFVEQSGESRLESHYAATVGDDGQLSIVSPQEVELKSGSALVEAKEASDVIAGKSRASMKKGSLALFRVEGTTARCFVLLGTVKIHAGDKLRAEPNAGTEVVLADHHPDQHELLYRDELGRRNPKLHKLENGLFLATAEFSLVQALDREPLVAALVHSKEPRDKNLKNKLIKTAAVLNMVTSHKGHYGTGR